MRLEREKELGSPKMTTLKSKGERNKPKMIETEIELTKAPATTLSPLITSPKMVSLAIKPLMLSMPRTISTLCSDLLG
jgi:hypothetical protein